MQEVIIDVYEKIDKYKRSVYRNIKHNLPVTLILIPKNPYKKALDEFIKIGSLLTFPEKLIYKWRVLITRNFSVLDLITELYGHSENFNSDIYCDELEENISDWEEAYKLLISKYNVEKLFPMFSNGQELISDFAIAPLENLLVKIWSTENINDILVIINMILDITHYRGDLAEVFIEGGKESCYEISNN